MEPNEKNRIWVQLGNRLGFWLAPDVDEPIKLPAPEEDADAVNSLTATATCFLLCERNFSIRLSRSLFIVLSMLAHFVALSTAPNPMESQ